MIRIGITGNIGSGKTTVCKIFEILDVPVYYADKRAKELMHESPVKEQVIALLGDASYVDGKLDRKYVAQIVFKDKKKLAALNSIVHPAVFKDADSWFDAQVEKPYSIKETALLFESSAMGQFDAIICVSAPEELRIQRVMSRDGSSESEVRDRIRNQMLQKDKEALSHYVIRNDGRRSLVAQILKIHRVLSRIV